MKILDPHLHFFNLQDGDYVWLKAGNPPAWDDKHTIARNTQEHDLVSSTDYSLAGYVHIEAGFDNQQPQREIAWIEQQASLPLKTIATVDLLQAPAEFAMTLSALLQYASLAGVRHIFDEQTQHILLQPQALINLHTIAEHGLIFELQCYLQNSEDVSAIMRVFCALPTLRVILNHAGFAPYDKHCLARKQWRAGLETIASLPNIALKLSAWEMQARDYKSDYVEQVAQAAQAVFSDSQIMLASNYPLCLFSCTYNQCWEQYQRLQLPPSWYCDNAWRWYGF